MLMFTGGLLTFMAIGGFPSFVEEVKVSPFYYIHMLLLRKKLNEKTLMIMRPRYVTRRSSKVY